MEIHIFLHKKTTSSEYIKGNQNAKEPKHQQIANTILQNRPLSGKVLMHKFSYTS